MGDDYDMAGADMDENNEDLASTVAANLPLSEGLRTWVIAVIVVCILLALCVIGGALYCLLKRRGNAQMLTVPKQNEKMEVPPLGSQLSRNI